jgi:uncharacterized membrane protein YbhN (UPF0104 family)
VFVGLALVGSGLRALSNDQLTYSNYWGGAVFAPFAIAAGVFVLIIVVVKWSKFDERERRPKLKGRAALKPRRPKLRLSRIAPRSMTMTSRGAARRDARPKR